MRSRTIQEGSVGLFILLGILLFAGVAVWLRGFNFGKRTYEFTAVFRDAARMQPGASVRYRGVQVGRIKKIDADTNGVNVTIEVTSTDFVMPIDAVIEANQTGLVGETSVDINPKTELPNTSKLPSPFDNECEKANIIICNQARLDGQIGVSFDELLRASTKFAATYSDPNSDAFKNINAAAKNAAAAAAGVTELNRELISLSRSVKQNLNSFSTATNVVTRTATQTANQFSNTAAQYSITANRLNQLVGSLNGLVVENRSTLVSTLNNFSAASKELRDNATSLRPLVSQASSTLNQFKSAQLIQNLETFSANAALASANAAQASANLRDASVALNNPQNLVVLQRTLDSARVTFENAQKITSDLDKLTGDPAFVENLRNLVNGLNKLVSSTQQLQQQVQIAEAIEPVNTTLKTKVSSKQTASALKLVPSNISFQLSAKAKESKKVTPINQSNSSKGEPLTQSTPTKGKPEQTQVKPLPQPTQQDVVQESPQPNPEKESGNAEVKESGDGENGGSKL